MSTESEKPETKERRERRRLDLALEAIMVLGGTPQRVTIRDITGAGAMLVLPNPPEEGTKIELCVEGFGDLPAEVTYSGDTFCGVLFSGAQEHRDKLSQWIVQRIKSWG